MTTKAPSPVKPATDQAMEQIAYSSVKEVPTVEPHDQDRLGYCVWLWMTQRRDTLEQAVRSAGVRFKGITEEDAVRTIREKLQQQGVKF